MPFTYTIDAARRLALVTVSGSATGRTLIEIARALADDPAWSPAFGRVIDARGLTEYVLTIEDQEAFIAEVTSGGKGARKTAVVLNPDTSTIVVALTRVQLRDHYPVQAFDAMDAAMRWIERA